MIEKINTLFKKARLPSGLHSLPINKSILIFFAWIGAALLMGGLLWYFTGSYRIRLLTEKVNKTLEITGGWRIDENSAYSGSIISVMGGIWFSADNSSGNFSGRIFVFTMLRNGIAAVCAALVDNDGRVRSIVPIGGNAEQITEKLPLPVYRFYSDRIERDALNRGFNREPGQ
ncbi:MAG: hypothetical protein LBH07_02490 [Treponema sp.]|nr:hypothetical protein [Treponema sp.]